MRWQTGRSVVATVALVSALALGCGGEKSGGGSATMTTTPGTTSGGPGGGEGTTAGTDGGVTGGGATGGGTSGGSGPGSCVHRCRVDADCRIEGNDVGLVCEDSRCVAPGSGCVDDQDCIEALSGWFAQCTASLECEQLGQICVKVPDGGRCATPPSEFITCAEMPGLVEMTVLDIDGNSVIVCGDPNAECNADGVCFSRCKSDADCTDEAYTRCDVGTGRCGCESDAACEGIGMAIHSVCHPNGNCGCGADQDCVDANLGDVCTASGACGCSSDAVCGAVGPKYDGGAVVCAP